MALLRKCLEQHRAGQWEQAAALYRKTLAAAPRNSDALHLLGLVAQQFRRHEEALKLIEEATKISPANAIMHYSRGSVLRDLRRHKEALASFETAIRLKPDYVDALIHRAECLSGLHRQAEALEAYDKVIQIKPDHVGAFNNRANTLIDLKRYEEAVKSFGRALGLQPDNAVIYSNLGNALQCLGRYELALKSYDQAFRLNPNYADVHKNRGAALLRLGRYEEAVAAYGQLVALEPASPHAYYLRGRVLGTMGNRQAALEDFCRVISLDPSFADGFNNHGVALALLGRCEEALASFDEAVRLNPLHAEAYKNRAGALLRLKRYQDAVKDCDQAILLDPNLSEAHSNRGAALLELKQYQAALKSCETAIKLNSGLADAYANRGAVLSGLEQFHAALKDCERSLEINPRNPEAHCNRAAALFGLRRMEDALASCQSAIELDPKLTIAHLLRVDIFTVLHKYPQARESLERARLLEPNRKHISGAYIHSKQHCCDWERFSEDTETLKQQALEGGKAVAPFELLAITTSAESQRKAAEAYALEEFPACGTSAVIPFRSKRDKIRVGYYSGDFCNHPLTHLMAGVFEQHDRSRFEIVAFSFSHAPEDDTQRRVRAGVDRFIDVRSMSHLEIAHLSRELGIDIAMDLMGYTLDNRAGIFAERAAPVQVNYLGLPATMGAKFIDYIIADDLLIPEGSRRHYSEKIVYLPDTYQANDAKCLATDKRFSRGQEGLPEDGFVYCCFNASYKIAPSTFDVWMRVLGRVQGSVLWLQESNPWAVENLRKEAIKRGVAPERLIFASRLPLADHLERQRLADLFLDTLPYNAGATASAALRAGLPILTCAGEAFASRMAASLLRAIDLPELITMTLEQYEQLAVALAETGRIQAVKQRLQRNLSTTPLFDVPTFTRHLEAGFTEMHDRFHAGLEPDHIFVRRLGKESASS